jgi:hypothetical protein
MIDLAVAQQHAIVVVKREWRTEARVYRPLLWRSWHIDSGRVVGRGATFRFRLRFARRGPDIRCVGIVRVSRRYRARITGENCVG